MNSAMMPQPGIYQFPSLSGKTFIRTGNPDRSQQADDSQGFHPFQGRPSFGPYNAFGPVYKVRYVVSIPFREDLHSDSPTRRRTPDIPIGCFHPFQGRPSFGQKVDQFDRKMVREVSIPFREDLHSDATPYIHHHIKLHTCFHPFQGRPSFGPPTLQD